MRVLVGLIFILVFIIFLFLTTINYRFLDPAFMVSILRDADTYEKIEVLVKRELQKQFIKEFEEEGVDFAGLPVNQQRAYLTIVDETLSSITDENIQDLIETNIFRLFSFVKKERAELTLYIPLNEWGFPSVVIKNTPFGQYSEETELEALVESQEELQELNKRLSLIQGVVQGIGSVWIVSIFVLVILLVIHFMLSKKPGKILPTSRLLVYTGVAILLLSGGAFYLASESVGKVQKLDEVVKLIAGAVIPQMVAGVVFLWLTTGGILIAIGVVVTAISVIFTKKDQTTQKVT